MKHLLTKSLCAVLFTLMTVAGFSQNLQTKKPALFGKLPGTIKCTAAELSKYFAVVQGQSTDLSFDNSFKAKGVVANKVVKFQNLETLTIKLPEFNNAIFGLSKRLDENKNIVYSGRIINPANSDAFELKKIDANNYQLVKINLEDILQDCAH
ncbi:hypothetical protein ACQ33O_01185 [Ferruginibacter sp. SUN002]|uniref:hypothetical protein n=1 Tax=Ferruginibacter sp. SUN002 TaxID=2937789 RepID=UPI003D3693D3